MKKYCIISTLVVVLSVLLFSVQARTWTSNDGEKIDGEFVELTDNGTKVRIKKSNNKFTRIALDKLSKEDQDFVKSQTTRSGDAVSSFKDEDEEESTSTDESATPSKEIPKKNWYAFIVGVNTYADNAIQNLKCCVSDATVLADKFKALGFPEKNITLLVDSFNMSEQPSKENIENKLKKLTSELPENSLIIFSFAGHGIELEGKGACFLPADADRSELASTVVLAQDICDCLENSKASIKLMLVDACRDELKRGSMNLRSFNMENTKGLAFLQSCSYNESSHEDPQTKHGYFTLTFLEALDGKADANHDGIVTLSEIFDYTSRETKERVKKERFSSQQPIYSYKGTTNNGVTIQDFPMVTGLLVDGLTKKQRDEAEGYYNEADKAFTDGNYTLAQEKINKALGIYVNNEKYKKLKNTIDSMVKALDAQKKAEADKQAEAEARRQAEQKAQAEAEARKKAEEQARLAGTTPSVTPSTSYVTPSTSSKHKAGDRMVKTVNGVEFAFRWCPAGTFMMGSPTTEEGRNYNETQHRVTLTNGFWMMETEVTQKQWKTVMETTVEQQHAKADDGRELYGVGDDYPMYYISWNECQEFCKKCTELGLPVCLPTEAQWEYACRAGSTTVYFWGNSLNGDKANCNGNEPYGTTTMGHNLGKTTSVKMYSCNEWGLYDMHGNVFEWCEDWYVKEHSCDDVTDPVGPSSGSECVFRGGGWNLGAVHCRSAFRFSISPDLCDSCLGFRVVVKGQ